MNDVKEVQTYPDCVWDRSKETSTHFICKNCAIPHIKRGRSKNPIRPCTAMPSYAKQVKNYARSAYHWTKRGFKRANKLVKQHRLTICRNCPANMSVWKRLVLRCRHTACGCALEKKASILAKKNGSDCPLDFWPIIDADGNEL